VKTDTLESDDTTLNVPAAEDESMDIALSRALIRPTLNSALSIRGLNRLSHISQPSINALIDELGGQIELVNEGDMSRPEALLVAQAHTLDALFGRLLDASIKNMGEYLGATESYMRLALKAQSQCAQTIRVLNELKNPKNVAFIQQANLSNGHQQVNNSPARENKNQQNELLEAQHGERLDFGTQAAAGGADKDMETVGAIYGAEE
jgi:hypothetical protein